MSHKWWNVFLDSEIFKGPHFSTLKILNSQSHCKPTETFQCTHFSSCHPLNMKRGFIKGEALSLLRTNLVRRILTNTDKIFNKDSVTEAILWRLFIKSFLKFSSSSQQRPFITKQRRWKKFYHLLPLIIHEGLWMQLCYLFTPKHPYSLHSSQYILFGTNKDKLFNNHSLAITSFTLMILVNHWTASL